MLERWRRQIAVESGSGSERTARDGRRSKDEEEGEEEFEGPKLGRGQDDIMDTLVLGLRFN